VAKAPPDALVRSPFIAGVDMHLEFDLSWIEAVFAFLNAEFKPILILVSSALGIYFASKKIGQKVSAQYSFGGANFEPVHIKEVVLSNKKDKPVNIYAVHAVFHDDLWLELERCSPPKVLKPYESLSLKMQPYSFLHVGSDEYEPDFMNADIHIESDDKVIKCESRYRPQVLEKYRKVSVSRHSYNGFVYDESVAFILAYVLNGSLRTAFIHESGYIGNEWDLSPNHLGQNATEANIRNMLRIYGFESIFSSYILYRVESPGRLKPVNA
jgi:hypothetical protein